MSRMTTFHPTKARTQLDAGIVQTELTVSPNQREQLIDYMALMAKWNHVYNLSAIRDFEKMVSHHLLDSLVIVPILNDWLGENHQPTVLDVGTGGGLPGIVLAIMQPDWRITLIDPVHKKTAFLRQVKAHLALTNLTVVTGKVEDLPAQNHFDVITSRAFASVIDFVTLSEKVLGDNGFFAAMKGVFPDDEMAELNAVFSSRWHATSIELDVPQLDGQRHIIQLKSKG